MTHASAAAVCPGCHFHCRLDHYMCGLGAYRWEQARASKVSDGALAQNAGDGTQVPKAANTTPVPQAAGGVQTPQAIDGASVSQAQPVAKPSAVKHHASAPADVRIEHLLTVLPHKLRAAAGERMEDKLLCAVMRRRGLAAPSIMAKLLYTNTAGLRPSIDALEAAGYLEVVEADGRPGFVQLTDEGMVEGKRRAAHHAEAYRELVGCLSDEEQAQLIALLSKLLAATKTA